MRLPLYQDRRVSATPDTSVRYRFATHLLPIADPATYRCPLLRSVTQWRA